MTLEIMTQFQSSINGIRSLVNRQEETNFLQPIKPNAQGAAVQTQIDAVSARILAAETRSLALQTLLTQLEGRVSAQESKARVPIPIKQVMRGLV